MKKHDPRISPITGETTIISSEWSDYPRRFRVEYDDREARYCVRGDDGWVVLQTAQLVDGTFDLTGAHRHFRGVMKALVAEIRREAEGKPYGRFEFECPIWQAFAASKTPARFGGTS